LCFSFLVSTVFAQNQWIHQSPIPKGNKSQPISTSLTVTAQFPQIFRNQKRPLGTCNLPPIPAPGETVTWTLANSPYEICQNITIPSTSTVIVEAGVHVNFDPDRQVFVLGTMHLQGQAAQHIVLNAPAVFPAIIDIDGGVFDAAFSEFTGQVRVENGANVALSDSAFSGNNAVLWAQELPTRRPFMRVERCTFTSSSAFITDAISVLTDNIFNGATCSVLRGFADVTATNTFMNGNFSLNRQESVQPLYIDGVHASNSTTAGLVLSGGNYFVGPNTVLQNNPFPVALEGGLLPGSAIPVTGNTVNAIDVGNGGFAGRGRWSPAWAILPAYAAHHRSARRRPHNRSRCDRRSDRSRFRAALPIDAARRFERTSGYSDHLPRPERTTVGRFAFCYKFHDRLPLGILHDRERALWRGQHG